MRQLHEIFGLGLFFSDFIQHLGKHTATIVDAPIRSQVFDLFCKFAHCQGVAHETGSDLFRNFAQLPFVRRPVELGRLVLDIDFRNEVGE